MADLDDRLREIALILRGEGAVLAGSETVNRLANAIGKELPNPAPIEERLEQIKTAFSEAGYRASIDYTHQADCEGVQHAWLGCQCDCNPDEEVMRTGEEWYNRYDREVKTLVEGARSKEVLLSLGQIHRMAAERAAGLQES